MPIGAQQWRISVGKMDANIKCSIHCRHCGSSTHNRTMHGHSPKRLYSVFLALSLLVALAGDVELNPGPETGKVTQVVKWLVTLD